MARACRVMLVVIGETWQSDTCADGDWKGVPRLWNPQDWVRREITIALDAGNVVVPVCLNEARLPTEGWLKQCALDRLHRKQAETLRSTEYETDFTRLLAVLRVHCPGAFPTPPNEWRPPVPKRWPHLSPQQERELTHPYAAVHPPTAGGLPGAQVLPPATRLDGWPELTDSVEVALPRRDREQLIGWSKLAPARMCALGYPNEAVEAYQLAFLEATVNALEHGCRSDADVVTVELVVRREYSSFLVRNPAGSPFHLESILREGHARLSADPRSNRGRGLLLIRDLADQLSTLPDDSGIKAVFAKDRVLFSVSYVEDVAVITLLGGIHNESFRRRTVAVVAHEAKRNMLLDFSRWETGGTACFTVILDAEAILARAKRRFVALLAPSRDLGHGEFYCSPIELPEELVAYDVASAAEKLGRSDLRRKLAAVVASANRKRPGG